MSEIQILSVIFTRKEGKENNACLHFYVFCKSGRLYRVILVTDFKVSKEFQCFISLLDNNIVNHAPFKHV